MQYDEDYFNSEEFLELFSSYEASVQDGSYPFMDADDLVDIADYYNYIGDFDKAIDTIDHALMLYPNATLPNVFKSREALMNGHFDTARYYAERIASKDDPDYHYLVAEILIAEGRADEADSYLLSYGTTVPDDEYRDFVKDCANLYIDYGVSDKAYEWMQRAKGDESDDFKELMARTLFGLGKYQESGKLFDELIDSDPYSTTYWNGLSNAQFMAEDYSGAVTSSEYALAINPEDPDGLVSKANGLFRLGNYEEALSFYRRYNEVVGDDDYGLLHQGICLVNAGKPEEAIPALLKALEAAEDEPASMSQIYLELAFCYSTLRLPTKALEMLDKADALPCDPLELRVIRGHILLENDLVEDAEKSFKQAIEDSGYSPSVILRVIVSLYDNHYLNACYQMFKKLFSITSILDKDFKDGYAYMALCCYDLNKAGEFLHYLRLAVRLNPREAHLVLSPLFPEDMEVADYYAYMNGRMKKLRN